MGSDDPNLSITCMPNMMPNTKTCPIIGHSMPNINMCPIYRPNIVYKLGMMYEILGKYWT
jgi:hypothetical protein